MRVPTVHLNGTSKGDLMRDQQRVIDPLRQAIIALRITGPNGRDYYPQNPLADGTPSLHAAVEEHRARLEKLNEVLAELESLVEQIDAQD